MADVYNDKHIIQLGVTFSTEMKGRHSFIIAAVEIFSSPLFSENKEKCTLVTP